MTDIDLPLVLNLLVFLTVPFIGGLVASRLKIPRMVGYIAAGIVLGLFIHGDAARFLPLFANFGLIFLLFTVGLELNINTIRRFGTFITLMTILQVGVVWAIFLGLLVALGLPVGEAAIVGFAFSLSSTALVSKYIQEKGDESSLVGTLTMGILILQDIVVIPFMMVLDSAGKDFSWLVIAQDLGISFIRAGIVIAIMFVLAQKVIPLILARIAKISRELLNLFTLVVICLCIGLFSFLGLSPAIAAFVAGIIIGGTLEHYQIFSQVRPLRDISTILFFVFLGATINIAAIIPVLPQTLFFGAAVIFVKFVVVMLLFMYFRYHSKTAYAAGILLAQVGEFAFIVMHQAQNGGLISENTYAFGIASTLVTLALSPALIEHKDVLYKKGRIWISKHAPALHSFVTYRADREPSHIEGLELRDHVVICGYGRVGSYIGRALTLAKIPFIAIDYNYHVVERERKKGINIMYGDPTDIDILDFAQVEFASAVVAAVPDAFSQEMIILNAKLLQTDVAIFTRVNAKNHQQRLRDLGAQVVVQPEFEAALSIIRKVFLGYNVPKKDITGKVQRLKLEHGMA